MTKNNFILNLKKIFSMQHFNAEHENIYVALKQKEETYCYTASKNI